MPSLRIALAGSINSLASSITRMAHRRRRCQRRCSGGCPCSGGRRQARAPLGAVGPGQARRRPASHRRRLQGDVPASCNRRRWLWHAAIIMIYHDQHRTRCIEHVGCEAHSAFEAMLHSDSRKDSHDAPALWRQSEAWRTSRGDPSQTPPFCSPPWWAASPRPWVIRCHHQTATSSCRLLAALPAPQTRCGRCARHTANWSAGPVYVSG